MSAIAVIAMLFIPMPATSDVQQQATFAAMRPFFASIYAVPLLIGVWWLVYFNRATTRAAFAVPYVPGEAPARPLSISIIGWFSVVGGVIAVPMSLAGLPAFLAGFLITGLPAALIYAGFGGIGIYLGWSVLKLNEIGRRAMIGWYVLTMAHSAS